MVSVANTAVMFSLINAAVVLAIISCADSSQVPFTQSPQHENDSAVGGRVVTKHVLTPEFNKFIAEALANGTVPGLTLGVVHPDGEVEFGAYGRRTEEGDAMTTDVGRIPSSSASCTEPVSFMLHRPCLILHHARKHSYRVRLVYSWMTSPTEGTAPLYQQA